MKLPIDISDKALNEVRKILREKSIPEEYSLRIGIKGSLGCSGADFIIGFDQKTKHDEVFDKEGIKIFIDRRHFLYLAGHSLMYYDEADGLGFSFEKISSI